MNIVCTKELILTEIVRLKINKFYEKLGDSLRRSNIHNLCLTLHRENECDMNVIA